ncbi:AMP-binding protein [Streptomyces sp. AP-93]|uniref:AMP-binding protein n=1 Tax=Streptomyces sp. AP-93 TaxID=2929048 RepID=UPI001FB03954|nr:AMP-binding protein [Streptomyces sp. AP-93]MCJ0869377.1 AMP-binding protein [Streptomyces sp. AP-93]
MTQGSESFTHFGRRADDTVLSRFERWVRDTPGAHALAAGTGSLTYGQLDARANQSARHLLDSGLLPERAVVAVGSTPRAELLVLLLGILKAGAAYTVVDVENPRTGQRQLAAARPCVLLADAADQARLDDGGDLRVILLGAQQEAATGRLSTDPPDRAPRGDAAAVLFTGGADRRAVPLSQERLLAAHEGWARVVGPVPEDRHLITAAPDLTGFAAGWTRALCEGGTLVLPEGPRWTPASLRRAVDAERVTVLHTDPDTAAQLLVRDREASLSRTLRRPDEGLRSLRMVTVTGDRLYLDEQAALLARLRPGARLLNVYGPTEAAGVGARFELPQLAAPLDGPEELSLIGTAFPGCELDVRDGQIHLTVPGGGEPIPTGDLGVLRPDGLLEFRGRLRDRLTVEGKAFDPYPVESAIRGHEAVGAALLAEVKGAGTGVNARPMLVAFLAPAAEDDTWPPGSDLPDGGELRRHLAGRLPGAMMPSAVFRLPRIPRDRAGREQRAALPMPPGPAGEDRSGGGSKYGGAYARGDSGSNIAGWAGVIFFIAVGLVLVAGFTMLLTMILWPGSTDLSGVPNPYATLFFLLYLFECWAFAAGVWFLFAGRSRMRRHGRRGPRITAAAHLAIVYLLAAWWPQDNFYRLAAKQDWPQQAALVYAFNIPLMIAAGIVAVYASRPPLSAFDVEPDPDPDRASAPAPVPVPVSAPAPASASVPGQAQAPVRDGGPTRDPAG